ncbi:RNA polymerase sigma factor [Curtobacterium sp. SL109]|uniref:RNA polymerase sigma factor n=1 Tax=Curtobacterium sp. SL109 TaxID=2994662 RepID=UPI0022764FEB|nr:RNA polymerase sigma factor [Curtobacterium sp. SL109]MCY1693003.1 RNA polymerase sigma factor [Curtobacterium sp. SL109]
MVPEAAARSALEDAEDALLASRAAEGDVRAFAVLMRRYSRVVRAYARRVLSSSADVDDVTQDVFVTAWQQLPRLSDPAVVRGWLLRITTRKAIDRVRALRSHVDIDDHDQEAPEWERPDRLHEAASREQAMSVALQALPKDQRRCWILKEFADYSYQDIAAELDVPVSTVRGLLSRARKNMIRAMEGWR